MISIAFLDSPRFRRAVTWYLAPVAILILNAAIAGRLFKLEYSANFGSNEGQFIAIARGVAHHLGDLSWWPEWSCGLPFQNTYLPLFGIKAGMLSWLTGESAALAFHQTGAAFFCIGPVFLYLLGLALTRKPVASFLAAALFSVFSPCALIPAYRADLGSLWRLRRLQVLAFYGEGPHTAAIALLPLAILFLYLVAERATWRRSALAGFFIGLTVISNAFGAVILAAATISLLATAPAKRFLRAAAAFTVIAGAGLLLDLARNAAFRGFGDSDELSDY